jgi:hypothetical protein
MRILDGNFATRMSRFMMIAAISLGACSTPLVGTIPCDEMTCGSGQLCAEGRNAPDDGSVPAMCLTVPASCPISDCSSDQCSFCIHELCHCTAQGCYVLVRGRTISC